MRLWTYVRPFYLENELYEVKVRFSFKSYTSALFKNGLLVDEKQGSFHDLRVIEHAFKTNQSDTHTTVRVGYYNWYNVGIEVHQNNALIYASHPDQDIQFAAKKVQAMNGVSSLQEVERKNQEQAEKWQKNKYALFADIALGAVFFIVAKSTDDLTLAALVGITLGLLLVVIQRFVKVDLLGGFAVFGTIMLLISAVLSLVFQSEYFVQIKGTVMGLIGASVFLTDGIARKGRYFAPRFERFLNNPVHAQYFVIGLGLIGLFMAGVNYCVATYLSEDTWLTYSTFLDMPLYMILFFTLISKAAKPSDHENNDRQTF
ncbi:membrane protein [Pseudoalteromonas luteoviolacea B = ATCC 29581]|nr:membrane protein [Pseudoalteromonas luteoviolacea B = ATCC 29581]